MPRLGLLVASWSVLVLLACGGSPAATGPARTPAASPPTAPAATPVATAAPEVAPPGLRLARTVVPQAYRARLRVDPAQATFTGTIEIDVDVTTPSALVWLHARDLTIERAVAVQGAEQVALTARAHGTDLLGLAAPRALAGRWTLVVSYQGKQDPLASAGLFHQQEGDAWYAYTQLEAIYARRVFPCFDEPGWKTPWTVSLEVPAALTALANTRAVRETATDAGWKRVEFAPTRPLPSYLVAFAVGPFELVDAGASRTGVPIRVVALRGKAGHARLAAELTPRVLAALEDYLDSPYPFDKLDLVAIPVTVGFGAMENPGLVTFAATALLFDPAVASPRDRERFASLAAHELGHQWFGNLVTLAWWDDIWLNEGLATWIEPRITSAVEPRPDDAFALADGHEEALSADSLATARAVRQPITGEDDILNVFDGVTYGKAAAVLAMYEAWVGRDRFQQGIQAYLRRHADGNATTDDFIATMSEATGRDLSGMRGFLDRPGAPRLRFELRCAAGQPPVLAIAQTRYLPPGAATPSVATEPWTLPVCVAHERGGRRGQTCGVIDAASAELVLDAPGCPAWVMPNVGGVGHYRAAMPAPLVAAATGPGWAALTPVERVVLAGDVDELMRAGELPLTTATALVPMLLREGTPAAVARAVSLGAVRRAVPEALVPAYDRWLVATFGPAARKLGWLRRKGEPADRARARAALVPMVANAGDRRLQAEAVKLSAGWRALPRDTRDQVLAAAVRAEPAVFDRLLAEARAERDRALRTALYEALAATVDPTRLERALGLLIDPAVDFRDVMYLAFRVADGAPEQQAQAYVRGHLPAILARMPEASTTGEAAVLAFVFTRSCDPATRDEVAAYVTTSFAGLAGGQRLVAQAIEGLDQCLAERARLQPQVERWLGATR